ncbi:MAG: DUF134 domain-containing protein [Candidatus Omnitrophica bacterium]|nr:DUF134 domain-containing protein [Candidatus Omnitrophota bacterium]
MRARGRPKKYRIVRTDPKISQFSPRGKAGRPDEVDLAMDEFEAIRLTDFLGLGQMEAARFMRISQPTFSRTLEKARRTIATALVKGTIIKIQGGHYVISSREDPHPKRVDSANPANPEAVKTA